MWTSGSFTLETRSRIHNYLVQNSWICICAQCLISPRRRYLDWGSRIQGQIIYLAVQIKEWECETRKERSPESTLIRNCCSRWLELNSSGNSDTSDKWESGILIHNIHQLWIKRSYQYAKLLMSLDVEKISFPTDLGQRKYRCPQVGVYWNGQGERIWAVHQ
jgi:hypothetical protein